MSLARQLYYMNLRRGFAEKREKMDEKVQEIEGLLGAVQKDALDKSD
jgi:predicted nuclease with TOPRIM domain